MSPILVQIDFLFVINNLPPILHRFPDTAFNRSKIPIFRYPLVFNPTDGAVPYIILPEVIYL